MPLSPLELSLLLPPKKVVRCPQIENKLRIAVKLPALLRGASVAKPSGTPPKPPVFALRATPRSPVAIPPRASTRGILAKASEL
jgi:hypothetical protein